MFFIYKTISIVFLIISPIIVIYRIIVKKEDKKRFVERYAFPSKKRKNGKLIWIHCSSVGEFLSIIPVVEKLEAKRKITQILITTTTLSSSKLFNKFKLKKTIHQFFPIDNTLVINKFLNYWKPDSLLLCESEIWPNLIDCIKEKKIKLILVNGRLTKRSFERWKIFKNFSSSIFEKFDICFAQNYETQIRLKKLGAKKIKYLGNLKLATSKKVKTDFLEKKIINFFKNKKILITAASTHFNEENFVIQSHLYFKKKLKNIISIIVPRHVERAEDIANELKKLGLRFHVHSRLKKK